jgi:Cytochrome c
MADAEGNEQLEKRTTTDSPEPDPIADSSMSGLLMLFSLLLVGTLFWSLYDEVFGQRPWKVYQEQFVELYSDYLDRIRPRQKDAEKTIKESSEYQDLDQALKDAEAEAAPRVKELNAQIKLVNDRITDVTEPFQEVRAWIAAKTYALETTGSDSGKNKLRRQIQEKKNDKIAVGLHNDAGVEEDKKYTFTELESLYNDLRDEKARLTADLIELTKPANEARKKRDDYLQEHLVGLTDQQVGLLVDKMGKFDFKIQQINVANGAVVDRCESCHLGTREPLTLTAKAMDGNEVFVSHPNRDLLKTHDPERFGCSTCHGGNGRGTTSVDKAHGRYKHWLWPLYYPENVQAGCNQCHNRDRVTYGADVLNHGKDLFQNRGCNGCHRYEGFDRESEAIANSQQQIKQLEMDRQTRLREIQQTTDAADQAETNEEARKLLARANELRQIVSQIDARIDEVDTESKYLMQDQKKIGPNLKEIKAKLKKEWLPVWLRDPQAFRPGTKMPSFRLEPDQVKAVAAFIWQSALDVKLPAQPAGDANHGRELFKTLGCLGCHSIDGKAINMTDQPTVGGTFAANLSRVGEKANYEYIVRWVHNPRQRLAPYSPSEKRDLTPADYAKKGLPFVFDDTHSKSPIDGREIQVQNMTVMPNFRLSDQDARDVATFLISQKRIDTPYPDASFLDDPSLKERGEKLAKNYGCAGCHEIKGLEEEQRIGTELTPEGSKPIERLDFALLTEPAKKGEDPYTGKETRAWYDHKGFFENKLRNPAVYDRGKEKAPEDRLRMPNIYLEQADITSLTTFLLGSVTTSLPESLSYEPTGGKKAVQDGWWVAQKYNCMGCHNVLIGQDSILMGLPAYQDADGREQLPPRLTSEGARVDPNWMLHFLKDPSLAGPQPAGVGDSALAPQPGANHNGVRLYLKTRMPTFNFSPNELQALVNFFMGASSQQQPYIPERLDPLTPQEQDLARSIFTSPAAPCLKCHMTGDAGHDVRATAPNFLLARERLKPAWTRRWVVEPQLISPGTSMPSGLFERDPAHDRWVIKGIDSPAFQAYDKDHVSLLVRYMFQITPEEQRRLVAAGAGGGRTSSAPTTTSANPADRFRRWRPLVATNRNR